jgi:hypothetical protein
MELSKELILDESTALSFADISKILSGRVKHLSCVYVDLENYKKPYTVEHMLGKHNVAAILLTVKLDHKIQRHWTALLRVPGKGREQYQFFDSLALKWPVLSELLNDGGKFVGFLKRISARPSTKQLQEHMRKVRTCGAWVAIRAAKYKLTNSQFVHWILSIRGMHGDQVVVMLCYLGLLT